MVNNHTIRSLTIHNLSYLFISLHFLNFVKFSIHLAKNLQDLPEYNILLNSSEYLP